MQLQGCMLQAVLQPDLLHQLRLSQPGHPAVRHRGSDDDDMTNHCLDDNDDGC